VIVGIIITAIILVATAATIIVVALRTQYSKPEVGVFRDHAFKSQVLRLRLLDVAHDPKGDVMQIKEVGKPTYGSIEIEPDRLIARYTAPDRFAGEDYFTFTIENTKEKESSYAIITVKNKPPVPVHFDLEVPEKIPSKDFFLFEEENEAGSKITDPDIGDGPFLELSHVEIEENSGSISYEGRKMVFYPNHSKPETKGTYIVTDGNDTATSTFTIKIRNFPPTCNCSKNLLPTF